MRFAAALLALPLLASAAVAQDRNALSGGSFDSMRPADAARLNEAVRNDPQRREALDTVEKRLNEAGHRAGQMLEKTRP